MIWPATAGDTGWKTVAIRFRSPRALRTLVDFAGRPMAERMSVIRKYDMMSDKQKLAVVADMN
jgi:hypothetical protein